MKNKQYDGVLAATCIFLFLATGFGIAALCLLNSPATLFGFPLKYAFAVVCGVFLLCYAVILIVSVVQKRGKHRLGLSITIVVVGTLLVALSPLALILWVIQTLVDKIAERRDRAAARRDGAPRR